MLVCCDKSEINPLYYYLQKPFFFHSRYTGIVNKLMIVQTDYRREAINIFYAPSKIIYKASSKKICYKNEKNMFFPHFPTRLTFFYKIYIATEVCAVLKQAQISTQVNIYLIN